MLVIAATCWLLVAAPSVEAEPLPETVSTEQLVRETSIPGRDLMDLAERFGRIVPGTVPRAASLRPLDAWEGREDAFWVMGPGGAEFREAQAELRAISEHAYWYVEHGVAVDEAALREAAAFFDRRVYPLVRRYFGSEWLPGVDGDWRLTILLADLPGLAGYHSSTDAYPRQVQPFSNEREILYLNPELVPPGTPAFNATLAHELQHLIHWNSNPAQETWVDEGSAELAASLLGHLPASFAHFERQPNVQLTAWSVEPEKSAAHYQASFLFMRYLLERYLAPEDLYVLLARDARGTDVFDQFFAERGLEARFDDVFADWAVANFLDPWFPGGGRFGYRGLDVGAQVTDSVNLGAVYDGRVRQYGTNFIELQGDGRDVELFFRGQHEVRLVSTDAASGEHVWWSNRADNANTRLTRAFDLSEAQEATLRFQLWYDIETDYDYGYVLASADGGWTWTSLCGGEARVEEDPTGNNFGCGFTGTSGGGDQPVWVEDEVDLTPFVGREVLVRFEYVTDQAYNAQGFLVDAIEIPEIAFFDDGSDDQGWHAEGFIRSDNTIPQRYSARLLLFRDSEVEVSDLALDEGQSGMVHIPQLGAEVTRAVLAVSGLALRTLEPADYRLELWPVGMAAEDDSDGHAWPVLHGPWPVPWYCNRVVVCRWTGSAAIISLLPRGVAQPG